ncbi:60S ribosomal protein L34-A, putative [Entamoeba invadens IP1]|uniref:60S ribosomal protein L34-A, putative n=1 Tax=Entamoeba invadens IP1 TaxID=370355 RepID=UPI0002C3DB7C|nr:60S ribosomal protein L34-A, putative [Entamoeba invadens IP1]ELP90475.1 60S ribosomal protein L34-A, putative [Entamoeba invadens IP1]|eukprot:XP_004257246.1 60S ribosomal protein L34-A, putative [Entamoeba invadens IP1]
MAPRITYIRKHSYNTRSNRIHIVKTAGSKMTVQHVMKRASGPHCSECGAELQGIDHVRSHMYRWMPHFKRSVTRAYGGNKCAKCVQKAILRSFLISEHNLFKAAALKDMKEKALKAKEDKKKASKVAKK